VDALSDDELSAVQGSLINPARRILEARKGELPVTAVIGLRRTISAASGNAKGSAKTVLGDAVEELDTLLADAAENALIKGDEKAIEEWSKSTKLFADYYARFKGREGARKVIADMVSGQLQPEEVSKILFGARGVRQSNRGLALTRELKKELGVDSDEWQALRGEAISRLIQDANDTNFVGVKFASELEKSLTDHSALMRELFTPEEVQMLRQFSRVVKIVNSKARSTGNPSRSGDLLNYMSRIGGGALVDGARSLPIIKDVVESVASGRNARKVKKLAQPTP
jgi:hypothetical protein